MLTKEERLNLTVADVVKGYVCCLLQISRVSDKSSDGVAEKKWKRTINKINIETRRSTTLKQRVILVQGPC